jgi:hypothetical protein
MFFATTMRYPQVFRQRVAQSQITARGSPYFASHTVRDAGAYVKQAACASDSLLEAPAMEVLRFAVSGHRSLISAVRKLA